MFAAANLKTDLDFIGQLAELNLLSDVKPYKGIIVIIKRIAYTHPTRQMAVDQRGKLSVMFAPFSFNRENFSWDSKSVCLFYRLTNGKLSTFFFKEGRFSLLNFWLIYPFAA